MTTFFRWALALIFLTSLANAAVAQSSTAGKDFWLAFPQNAKYEFGQTIRHIVVVTALEEAEITVTAPAIRAVGQSLVKGVKLQKGEQYSFDLDTSLQCVTSEVIEDKGIHVGSTGLITVIASSARKASNDTYRIMPAQALGKHYMVVGYEAPMTDNYFTTQFTVIAAENGTIATIDLTSSTKGGRTAGERIEVKLDRGQSYTVQGKWQNGQKDLTGSMVIADKPVAVITGHSCAQIPWNKIYCDVLIEMAAPISSAGRDFIVPMMQEKEGYALRIVATEPETRISATEGIGRSALSEPLTLGSGEFVDVQVASGNWHLRSDKPVIVAQYALSNEADSIKIGDPFMTLIAPTSAYTSAATFSTPPLLGGWHHYLAIVCDEDAAESLRLNGKRLSNELSEKMRNGEYYVFQVPVSTGVQAVTSEGKLAVYSYGFGHGADNFDSYGTYCGPW